MRLGRRELGNQPGEGASYDGTTLYTGAWDYVDTGPALDAEGSLLHRVHTDPEGVAREFDALVQWAAKVAEIQRNTDTGEE
ncbi:MAG TPA: hypothetical protein VJP80_01855 [Candidatus Saccharimonadales bacterium]|nr:hypothetical protein [Candidatus Saccharimonadales bacterium]